MVYVCKRGNDTILSFRPPPQALRHSTEFPQGGSCIHLSNEFLANNPFLKREQFLVGQGFQLKVVLGEVVQLLLEMILLEISLAFIKITMFLHYCKYRRKLSKKSHVCICSILGFRLGPPLLI